MSRSPPRRPVAAALRISLLYAIFGMAWIVGGDTLMWSRGDLPLASYLTGVAKGLLFVVMSAALIYILVRREILRRERASSELATVLDLAPVGIVAIAADGRIARWNSAATRILGWAEHEVLGRHHAELGITPSDQATTPVAPDTYVPARSGARVPVRIFSSPAGSASDGATVLVFRDRREQIAAEAALRQAHKLEAVGRLAGGVAHEFNNILTAIIGHTVLLMERLAPGDDRRDHAAELRRAADRAAGLTRQLLVFTGKHVTSPSVIDVNAMLRDMRGLMDRVTGEHVSINVELDEALWPVRIDAAQLQQLVLNLVLNAREAMHDGGTITLGTANIPAQESRAHTDALPPGDLVRLRVADDGPGMTADTLAHLFEPFFTTKAQGTGLGLATAYGIVQQSDGDIRVRSERGNGATFDIFLPRAAARSVDETPVVTAAGSGATLLVVEDDAAVRELTCRVLRRAGHRVVSAQNGREALAVLSGGAGVSLVIADIVMPGMSGFELGVRVREDFPGLPILYTSGYAAAAAADSMALVPGTSFLEKPFRPDELLAQVASILAQRDTHGTDSG